MLYFNKLLLEIRMSFYRIIVLASVVTVIIGGFLVGTTPLTNQPQWLALLFVGLLTIPSWIGLIKLCGIKRSVLIIVILSITAIIVEGFALVTGIPYGHFIYHYGAGVKLFDIVPLTVPLAWSTIVIGSYGIVKICNFKNYYAFVICIILCMVVVDLLMDPVMVSLGVWTWIKPGWYYGVPMVNYLGWILSGAVGALIICGATRKNNGFSKNFELMTSGLYLFILFWIIIGLVRGLWVPSLIGIIFCIVTSKTLKNLVCLKNVS